MVEKVKAESVEVKLACETLGISRSGYYAWKKRPESEREQENAQLLLEIQRVYRESRNRYGSPRVFQILQSKGIACGENRVARLMAENDIVSCTGKAFKVKTTDSNHDGPIADRIFEQEHAGVISAPNQAWVGDITYVPTQEGWLFLAIFLDVFSRKIVGFSADDNMKVELVMNALEMALGRQNVIDGECLAHTDRGSQYAAEDYRTKLALAGIVASMSRKGNCYDNAMAESFFHTLKTELVYQTEFKTREEAKRAIFEFIEVWYNRQRIHSSIDYMTPEEYEKLALAA